MEGVRRRRKAPASPCLFDGQTVTVYFHNNQEARYDHHDI